MAAKFMLDPPVAELARVALLKLVEDDNLHDRDRGYWNLDRLGSALGHPERLEDALGHLHHIRAIELDPDGTINVKGMRRLAELGVIEGIPGTRPLLGPPLPPPTRYGKPSPSRARAAPIDVELEERIIARVSQGPVRAHPVGELARELDVPVERVERAVEHLQNRWVLRPGAYAGEAAWPTRGLAYLGHLGLRLAPRRSRNMP